MRILRCDYSWWGKYRMCRLTLGTRSFNTVGIEPEPDSEPVTSPSWPQNLLSWYHAATFLLIYQEFSDLNYLMFPYPKYSTRKLLRPTLHWCSNTKWRTTKEFTLYKHIILARTASWHTPSGSAFKSSPPRAIQSYIKTVSSTAS